MEAERQVTSQEGVELAKQYNCPFLEASAKTRVNTNQMFLELLNEVVYKELSKLPLKKKEEKCSLQ